MFMFMFMFMFVFVFVLVFVSVCECRCGWCVERWIDWGRKKKKKKKGPNDDNKDQCKTTTQTQAETAVATMHSPTCQDSSLGVLLQNCGRGRIYTCLRPRRLPSALMTSMAMLARSAIRLSTSSHLFPFFQTRSPSLCPAIPSHVAVLRSLPLRCFPASYDPT